MHHPSHDEDDTSGAGAGGNIGANRQSAAAAVNGHAAPDDGAGVPDSENSAGSRQNQKGGREDRTGRQEDGLAKAGAGVGARAAQEAQKSGRIAPEQFKPFVVAMSIAVLAASLGDVSLKKGVSAVHSISSMGAIPHLALRAISDVWLDAGVVLMIVHFAAFVRALRLGPLSLVVPLRSSAYIFTTLLAQYFLHEQVTPVRWLGILIILVGVSMVGRSGGGDEGDV